MRRAVQRGFTLIEMVLALALLAAMLGMAWSGLTFSLRGWDTGVATGQKTADARLAQNFLRRELSELFPMRWKDPVALKFAFDGESRRLRFVSSRPAGLAAGGLALVGLEVESHGSRQANLVMRRALPDDAAKDFGPLDKAEGIVLFPDVESVEFAYFGADSEVAEPRWNDKWPNAGQVPQLVRLRIKSADGTVQPDFVARVMLGEEAGCLESAFQRACRARRP
jgi:general secretion pathway protein J